MMEIQKYKNFDLNLKGCKLTSIDNSDPQNPTTVTKTATITFDGVSKIAGQNLLATTGSAANVAVGIKDITFGTPANLNLRDGDNTLTYSAFVKKAGAAAVTAGDFTTISTFENRIPVSYIHSFTIMWRSILPEKEYYYEKLVNYCHFFCSFF
ncbi:fimbrial protein [Providencia hangzhouensis]